MCKPDVVQEACPSTGGAQLLGISRRVSLDRRTCATLCQAIVSRPHLPTWWIAQPTAFAIASHGASIADRFARPSRRMSRRRAKRVIEIGDRRNERGGLRPERNLRVEPANLRRDRSANHRI